MEDIWNDAITRNDFDPAPMPQAKCPARTMTVWTNVEDFEEEYEMCLSFFDFL
jgi:hypothetical protein